MTATTFNGQGIKHIKKIAEMFREKTDLTVDEINQAMSFKYATKFVNIMRKQLGFEIDVVKDGRKIVSYSMVTDTTVDLTQWDKPAKVTKAAAATAAVATAAVATAVVATAVVADDDEDDTPVMDMSSVGVLDSSDVVMSAHAVESDWDEVSDVRDLLR